jgi:hypothetical protein
VQQLAPEQLAHKRAFVLIDAERRIGQELGESR